MFALRPLLRTRKFRAAAARIPRIGNGAGHRHTAVIPACGLHPQTSYWLSRPNEMVRIKTILLIVNGDAGKLGSRSNTGPFRPGAVKDLRTIR